MAMRRTKDVQRCTWKTWKRSARKEEGRRCVAKAEKDPSQTWWDVVQYGPRVVAGMVVDLPGYTANTVKKAAQKAQVVAQGPAEPMQKIEETVDIAQQVLREFATRGEQLERTVMENLSPNWNETKPKDEGTKTDLEEEEDRTSEETSAVDEDETVLRQAEAEVKMLLDDVKKIRMDAYELAQAKRDGKPYAMIQLRMQENLKNAKRAAEQVGNGIAQYTEAGPRMKQATDELRILLEEAQEWS